jgi:hypothetical protein
MIGKDFLDLVLQSYSSVMLIQGNENIGVDRGEKSRSRT